MCQEKREADLFLSAQRDVFQGIRKKFSDPNTVLGSASTCNPKTDKMNLDRLLSLILN